MLGCGNALISQEMYDDGYQNITNIDISQVVIDDMKERNVDRPNMTWEVMDVMKMSYEDNTFDIAIDKSTIDALLCGNASFLNVAKMTREVQRVVKTGGYYYVISYGRPDNRLLHFERAHLDFNITESTVSPASWKTDQEKKNKQHFIYNWQKGENWREKDAQNWDSVEEELIKLAKGELEVDSEEEIIEKSTVTVTEEPPVIG